MGNGTVLAPLELHVLQCVHCIREHSLWRHGSKEAGEYINSSPAPRVSSVSFQKTIYEHW